MAIAYVFKIFLDLLRKNIFKNTKYLNIQSVEARLTFKKNLLTHYTQ